MKRNDENNYTLKEAFASSPDLPESLSKERMVEMLKIKEITPKRKVKILPKIATDIPATMIVVFVAPSQTISNGARADFGRLFSITR